MIFPVVLSFDKEIAFENRIHIKRRSRGTMTAGKSQFFHSSDTLWLYIRFSCHLLLCAKTVARWQSYHTPRPLE